MCQPATHNPPGFFKHTHKCLHIECVIHCRQCVHQQQQQQQHHHPDGSIRLTRGFPRMPLRGRSGGTPPRCRRRRCHSSRRRHIPSFVKPPPPRVRVSYITAHAFTNTDAEQANILQLAVRLSLCEDFAARETSRDFFLPDVRSPFLLTVVCVVFIVPVFSAHRSRASES